MSAQNLTLDVRQIDDRTSVIDINGEVTASSDEALTEAYNQASTSTTRAIILNFNGLEYMNSGGIGLLVTLLVRANRQKQKLLAYGLSDHYTRIFELTRLNEAIGIYEDEASARAAVAALR